MSLLLLEGPGGLPGVKIRHGLQTKYPITLSGTAANLAVGGNATVTGNLVVTGTLSAGSETTTSQVITATSANALTVGPAGTTNPSFNVDTSGGVTDVTGLNVNSNAAGSGVALSALSSGTNESLLISAKAAASVKILGAASPTNIAGNFGLTNAAGSAYVVNMFNYNTDATPGGEIDLFRGATNAVQLSANGSNIAVLNGSSGVQLQNATVTVLQISSTETVSVQRLRINASVANSLVVGPNGATNPSFNVDASTASAATGLNVKSAAAAGGLAVTTISSGTDENLTVAAKGAGTITFNPAVTATAGGATADGIQFGSLSVGLYTGTGAPSFSAMNGSIYVDSAATTTTTRIYVNKSGAGTAGTTWTNLTTAA